MSYSYDLSTPNGLVRLMIPDHDPTALTLFQDEEIAALLSAESGVIKRAAALALEIIAGNRVMVLQVIKSNGLFTDGAKVADAILKRAQVLRDEAAYEEAQTTGGFDIAEQVSGNFSYRERLWDQILRQEGQG